jgi:hypothetical protein
MRSKKHRRSVLKKLAICMISMSKSRHFLSLVLPDHSAVLKIMKNGRKSKKTRVIGEQTANSFKSRLNIIKGLNAVHADYVVIGGVASNFHGIVRATRDLDLLIPKDVANTKKILDVLADTQAWGMAREFDALDVTQKVFTIIGDQPRVDLLTCAGKLTYEKVAPAALKISIDKVTVRVADIDSLIKTKQTDRPQDISDITQLRRLKKMK